MARSRSRRRPRPRPSNRARAVAPGPATAAPAAGSTAAEDPGPPAIGPDVDVPEVDVPEVDVPDVDVPDVGVPDVDLIDIGYVARPHGVRGALRVVTHHPESTSLLEVDELYLGRRRYRITSARPVQGAVLVELDGLRDRTRAESLRGRAVAVARDAIELDEGELLLADLVGCAVVLPDGSAYGTIAGVEVGPQDRLVIHDGPIERLLPLVPEFVVDIDLDAERVVVAPPEGLPESRRR
ncbi:ribosome maturation factor RimM [Haliangium sp.]|uniref:ribosome maturation factor RimM n=1 Tax=Haliangium sp. TaxID=2663208 RepID=UPI003D14434B